MNSLFNDELEHLRSKLAKAEKQLGTAPDKTEHKILKDMIVVLKQQIKIAEENDPACIKAREKEAAEKKAFGRKKEERKKRVYLQQNTYYCRRPDYSFYNRTMCHGRDQCSDDEDICEPFWC